MAAKCAAEVTACPVVVMRLADERCWRIFAEGHGAQVAMHRLREIMRLSSSGSFDFELFVCAGDIVDSAHPVLHAPASMGEEKLIRYLGMLHASRLPVSMWVSRQRGLIRLQAPVGPPVLRMQLSIIAQTMARQIQEQGGLLLHGALAEFDGVGVVLAGPSGVGKTTASNRLPCYWRSLSDDAALIVKGADGRYWAHPWPTWSRLRLNGEVHHSWDVQRAVPLAAVCFLSQNEADAITPMGAGCAAGLLAQSAEQAAVLMPYTSVSDRRAKRVERLDNACALSRSVPSYQLELSLTGAFWHLLEDMVSPRVAGLSPACATRPAAAGI